MSLSKTDVQRRLQQLTGQQFEDFIADFWELRGWDTFVTQSSNDRGVDVVAKRKLPYPEKILIQTKRYKPESTVGSPDIQQYNSLRDQEDGVDKVLVVTTGTFSSDARSIANDLNVKCIEGSSLAEMISGTEAEEIVRRYSSDAGGGVQVNHVEEPGVENQGTSATEKSTPSNPIDKQKVYTVEVTGLRHENTELDVTEGRLRRTGETIDFHGKIATLRLYSNVSRGPALIESTDEVALVDEDGQPHHPVTLVADQVPKGWQTHSTDGCIETPPGGTSQYFAAVSMPRGSEVREITIDRYRVSVDLTGADKRSLRNLPNQVEQVL